ncbi:MAG: head maturation protease, ClpP-related [Rhizomicrobium sp.]
MNKRTIDIGRLENFRSAYRRGAGAPLAGSFCRAATASAGVSELYLYGEIGEGAIAATDVVEALGKIPRGNTIRVRMNSPGGDIFDGVAIYNLFAQSSARVEVCIDALAASMASVIAMAGDDIAIAGNASMMIHEAWGVTYGNADDM